MNTKTKTIVGVGLLTAIVVVLQALAISIRFGIFTITLVLAPIIVGTALYGYLAGAWLGFIFGLVVLLTDAGTFLAINVPGTIITCLLKGIMAGLLAGLVYRQLSKTVNSMAAVVVAGIVAPIVNTGIFLIGCRLFFFDIIKGWAEAAGVANAGVFMFTTFVGINFLIELLANLALSTVIVRIIDLGKKQIQ